MPYDPKSYVAQILAQFDAKYAQATATAAALRGQIAQLASIRAQLAVTAGLPDGFKAQQQLKQQIAIPSSLTPRMGGDPDMMRMPFVPSVNASGVFQGVNEDDLAANGGEQPIYDEEVD